MLPMKRAGDPVPLEDVGDPPMDFLDPPLWTIYFGRFIYFIVRVDHSVTRRVM